MPRKPRQIDVGKIYHIFNRGVEKRKIFLKLQDYSRFILCLEFFNSDKPINIFNLIEKFNFDNPIFNNSPVGTVPTGQVPARQVDYRAVMKERLEREREKPKNPIVELMAFALMPNHYHLIIREIIPGGISFFMKKIGGYSTYFNKQYERHGSLLQSRFNVVEIENDAQLSTIFTYAHTNPVELIEPGWKNFKVENPEKAMSFLKEYENSSLRDYIGIPTFPRVTDRKFFTDFFNQGKGCEQAVEDWIKYKAQQTKHIDPNIFLD